MHYFQSEVRNISWHFLELFLFLGVTTEVSILSSRGMKVEYLPCNHPAPWMKRSFVLIGALWWSWFYKVHSFPDDEALFQLGPYTCTRYVGQCSFFNGNSCKWGCLPVPVSIGVSLSDKCFFSSPDIDSYSFFSLYSWMRPFISFHPGVNCHYSHCFLFIQSLAAYKASSNPVNGCSNLSVPGNVIPFNYPVSC